MGSIAAKAGKASTVNPTGALHLISVAAYDALVEIGKAETQAIEAHLSVPVERGFGGQVIQRSEPGEAPRKDEDILRQNVEQHVVTEAGSPLPVLYITAHRPPQEPDDDEDAAIILEEGGISNWGHIAARPFMGPAAQRIAAYAAEVLAKHLNQATGKK